jgi:hypothetical protein
VKEGLDDIPEWARTGERVCSCGHSERRNEILRQESSSAVQQVVVKERDTSALLSWNGRP